MSFLLTLHNVQCPLDEREIKMTALKRGRYRHFKGAQYEVIDVALHSETQEAHVVYRALYGDCGLWVRPLAMFDETIERDGRTFKRFSFEGEV